MRKVLFSQVPDDVQPQGGKPPKVTQLVSVSVGLGIPVVLLINHLYSIFYPLSLSSSPQYGPFAVEQEK